MNESVGAPLTGILIAGTREGCRYTICLGLRGVCKMDVTSRRLAALFAVGLVALYPPLLGAFNRPGNFLGIPILPLYLFTVWSALVLISWVLTRGDEP